MYMYSEITDASEPIDYYNLIAENYTKYNHCGNTIKRTIINDRFFLYTDKKNDDEYDLLIVYPRARDICWDCALNGTNLIRRNKNKSLIIVFAQASGKIQKPTIHPKYNTTTYGELYFEVRETSPQFNSEVLYTKTIIKTMREKFKIKKVSILGISNGGILATLMAIHLQKEVYSVCSYVGGIGWDEEITLNFSKLSYSEYIPKVLFYTSIYDSNFYPCKAGYYIFKNEDIDCEMVIDNSIKHKFEKDTEEFVVKWLFK